MKAITIWQPWASLIAGGAKVYETRSWPTKYRGPIAIHAAKQDPCKLPLLNLRELERITNEEREAGRIPGWATMPTGAVIATGEIVNVWYIVYNPGTNVDKANHIPVGAESLSRDKHAPDFGDYIVPTKKEMALGDWTPGRYAWEIRNIRILKKPIKVTGRQGLWNWDEKGLEESKWEK